MSGHGQLYDWQDLETEDLEKALNLMGKLEDLGFQCCSDEMKYSIQQEIEQRKKQEPFYTVTRVCKDDMREVFKEDLEKLELIDKLTDDQMRYITQKLADDYINQLYWNSLKIIAKSVLESAKP